MKNVLTTDGLAKAYGKNRVALWPLSIDVPRGGVTAVLGRNGSGKSTLIRMVMGLEAPTEGEATLLGCPSTRLTPGTRELVGYLIEGHPMHERLRVRTWADCERALHPRWDTAVFERVLEHFRIAPDAKCGSLSRGQRGGLSLGLTMAAQPELLVMDDPALGLDPVAKKALREALLFTIRDPERSVLIATHDLADVERLADRVLVLDRGEARAWCSTEELGRRVLRVAVSLRGDATPDAVPGLLTGRHDPEREDAELMVVVGEDRELDGEQLDVLERAGTVRSVTEPGFEAAALAFLEEGPVSEGFLAGVR